MNRKVGGSLYPTFPWQKGKKCNGLSWQCRMMLAVSVSPHTRRPGGTGRCWSLMEHLWTQGNTVTISTMSPPLFTMLSTQAESGMTLGRYSADQQTVQTVCGKQCVITDHTFPIGANVTRPGLVSVGAMKTVANFNWQGINPSPKLVIKSPTCWSITALINSSPKCWWWLRNACITPKWLIMQPK